MVSTDEAIANFCDAMAQQYGRDLDFELALGDMVGKIRVAHERRMRDAEAARLLPLGREVAAERLGVAPSTVYKMFHRFRKFSTPEQAA